MQTKHLTSDTSALRIPLTTQLLALGIGLYFVLASTANAQTIISGPTIPGGVWSASGNPFIITGDASVASGQTLTIQPGVIVWLGSNVTLTANGALIQAVGTPSQRITFQAASSTYYFGRILLEDETGTNRFKYCDFANATTAIAMYVYGTWSGNAVMPVEIMNCTFSNCINQAIYGEAQGQAGTFYADSITLNPVIKNCYFTGTGGGCSFLIDGQNAGFWGIGYGYANLNILNNVFYGLITNSAIALTVGGSAGGSAATVINNTIVNCDSGFSAADPWDATVRDCVFVGCNEAVADPGSLSRQVSFNDFYGNATNFFGYGPTYGQWIIQNRNATLADVLYNISENPLFVATNDFHLTSSSPCVNAGIPDPAFEDMCVPPAAVRTKYPELGAYGGPDACNWLDTVPELPTELSVTASNGFVRLNWEGIPRSTYEVQYFATNINSMFGTNKWLTNATVIPAANPVSIAVSPYPTTNPEAFFRVRSLGRRPGN